jgi:hypothetical protein
MPFQQKTLDLLDVGLSGKYNMYKAAPDEMRLRFFTESFWLESTNWEKYHKAISSINFNWQEFKYTEVTRARPIEDIINSQATGIYMFIVKADDLIYGMPKFVLYIGIAGENNSGRPVQERLKDYFYIEKVKKRNAVLRLLQKYYKQTYIAYSLLNVSTKELKRIETALLGYFYPIPNKEDFPIDIMPLKLAF